MLSVKFVLFHFLQMHKEKQINLMRINCFIHIKHTLTILTKGIGLFAEYSVQRYLLNTTFAAPFRPRSSMDRIGVS